MSKTIVEVWLKRTGVPCRLTSLKPSNYVLSDRVYPASELRTLIDAIDMFNSSTRKGERPMDVYDIVRMVTPDAALSFLVMDPTCYYPEDEAFVQGKMQVSEEAATSLALMQIPANAGFRPEL